MIILGFTGTQAGMNETQLALLEDLLVDLRSEVTEAHHGDCIGADKQFHDAIRRLIPKAKLVGHPPCDAKKRAWCQFDELWDEYDYLVRNQHIVDCSTMMIAAPNERDEKLRSGTWSTIRKARKSRKPMRILFK